MLILSQADGHPAREAGEPAARKAGAESGLAANGMPVPPGDYLPVASSQQQAPAPQKKAARY